MTNSFRITNENELTIPAEVLLKNFPGFRVFAFFGSMGSGKTTFIQTICNSQLEVKEYVTSPTFAIINEYNDKFLNPVYHFDFYRINESEEAMDLGLEDYFYSGNYCFIEWPEIIEELLPENYVQIKIEVNKNEERIISFIAINNK